MTTTKHESDALWGAAAIGWHIGRTRRQAFYLLEQGRLPAQKIGGVWVSTRSALDAHLAPAGKVAS